jgi:LysM repeat protein
MLTPESDGSYYHTVSSGETLSGIASYYGVATTALMAWNGLDASAIIIPGQKLLLQVTPPATQTPIPPAATATPSPTATLSPSPTLDSAAAQAPSPTATRTPSPLAGREVMGGVIILLLLVAGGLILVAVVQRRRG